MFVAAKFPLLSEARRIVGLPDVQAGVAELKMLFWITEIFYSGRGGYFDLHITTSPSHTRVLLLLPPSEPSEQIPLPGFRIPPKRGNY